MEGKERGRGEGKWGHRGTVSSRERGKEREREGGEGGGGRVGT